MFGDLFQSMVHNLSKMRKKWGWNSNAKLGERPGQSQAILKLIWQWDYCICDYLFRVNPGSTGTIPVSVLCQPVFGSKPSFENITDNLAIYNVRNFLIFDMVRMHLCHHTKMNPVHFW